MCVSGGCSPPRCQTFCFREAVDPLVAGLMWTRGALEPPRREPGSCMRRAVSVRETRCLRTCSELERISAERRVRSCPRRTLLWIFMVLIRRESRTPASSLGFSALVLVSGPVVSPSHPSAQLTSDLSRPQAWATGGRGPPPPPPSPALILLSPGQLSLWKSHPSTFRPLIIFPSQFLFSRPGLEVDRPNQPLAKRKQTNRHQAYVKAPGPFSPRQTCSHSLTFLRISQSSLDSHVRFYL